jgi:hypothetical protein
VRNVVAVVDPAKAIAGLFDLAPDGSGITDSTVPTRR